MTVKRALMAMRKAFESDPNPGGLKQVYIDNIAMLLHDKHGIIDHDRRNRIAEDLLKLLFYNHY